MSGATVPDVGRQVGQLPASAYRPGDVVIGEDGGESMTGTVSDRQEPRHAALGDVLVYWSGQAYAASSLGHQVPAQCLRLWPSSAQRARLLELQTDGRVDAD